MNKIIVVLFLVFTSSLFAQSDYEKTFEKMYSVSGMNGSYKPIAEQMTKMLGSEVDKVAVEQLFRNALKDLMKRMIPVYKKYLTIDDLKAIIAFYETPVGKKFAQSQPAIAEDMMPIAQQWGMEFGQKMMELSQKPKEEAQQ